jgi:amidohydrolase
MSSEDFSYFLNEIPGAYIFIGTRNEKKNFIYDLHNQKFTIDEEALKVGIKVFVKSALDYLQ